MISAPIAGIHRYLLAGLALAGLSSASIVRAQTVSDVQVTPETMTLGVGQKQAIFATAFDQRGNLIPTAKFTFWSSDTLIAQVRKDGTVLGLSPGLAKIEARSQGKRASLAVLITGASRATAVASVLTLEPASVTLLPGESVRIFPQALREDGTPAPLGRVTWKSLRPEIASVDSVGTVAGLAPGRTIVQATTGSRLMATLPVEVAAADFVLSRSKLVMAPEDAETLKVLVPRQGNREIRGSVQWRSTDSTVAAVSPSGIVRARAPGQAEIIASGGSQERKVTVAVHQLPQALVVSPHQGMVQVPLRSTRQFTAVAEAADSSAIPEARVVWSLSDSAVAAFDPATGMLTPKILGSTTLTATLAGIPPATWTVQVVPGDIGLEPARTGLLVGQRATLTAAMREDREGSTGRPTGAKWSSDRPEVAMVRDGAVDALAPGHAVITATAPWGKSASADIFVTGDLVLTSNRGGSYGIYQMRLTGTPSLLPVLADTGTNIQAVLSPDRTRVAFSSNRAGTNYDIYVMDSDGRNVRRLTSNPGNEGEPAWTPDGKRILYTATTGAATQIASISLDGSDNRQLTMGPSRNLSPSVSADGRTIAFVSTRDGNQEIYTMGLDGNNQRRITKSSARETSPRFFPSGDLVYVTERGGKSKGSRVMRGGVAGSAGELFETEQPIASLALSRDGQRLAYVVGRLADASKGRVEFTLFVQSTSPRSQPVAISLRPGEQVLNPSF